MLASQLRNEIAEGKKDERLLLLYGKNLESQRNRYISSIDKFIELYGDKEISIISVPGRSEVIGKGSGWC